MRFAIYGAGGLGGYYGARLAEVGNEVAFIARGEHLAAIRAEGLRVLSPLGDVHLTGCTATDDPAEIGAVDVVLVAVKTWQIPEVARAMRPLVGAATFVVPFLNGVEAADQLAEVLGEGHVLGGLSKVFSMIEAPGVIRHFSNMASVEFGELGGGASARAESLREVLEAAGVEASVTTDVRSALWRKLLMVSSWAGLGALARSPMGVMRSQPETRALIDRSAGEGIDVGHALGHNLPADFRQQLWSFYDGLPHEATASMMRDIMAGKPSELDAWNGAVVRFGESLGVETPLQTFTYHALLPMERRARGEI
jgi:2-dehydropantoate 2-reductase